MNDLFWRILVFDFLAAFVVAKLEIEVEGKYGWAAHLPTAKIDSKFIQLIFTSGTKPFTNYHLWLFLTVLVFLHLPFFVDPSFWSVPIELFLLGNYMLAMGIEDFLWFVFNPKFGIGKLNKEHAPWHRWIGPIPILYFRIVILFIVFLGLSWYIQTK